MRIGFCARQEQGYSFLRFLAPFRQSRARSKRVLRTNGPDRLLRARLCSNQNRQKGTALRQEGGQCVTEQGLPDGSRWVRTVGQTRCCRLLCGGAP